MGAFSLIVVINLLNRMSVYTSLKVGSDETGDGSALQPYKSVLKALLAISGDETTTIYVDNQEEDHGDKPFVEISAYLSNLGSFSSFSASVYLLPSFSNSA